MTRLADKLRANTVTLFLCPAEKSQESLQSITRELQKIYTRIIITSYRQPASVIKQEFTSASIETKKVFFVDAITASVRKPEKAPDTLFVSSPSDITELSLILSELLRSGAFPIMILDGVTAMRVYQEHNVVVQFLHNLITKCRVMNVKLVLILSQQPSSIPLIKDVQMFVDDVIELSDKELLEQPLR